MSSDNSRWRKVSYFFAQVPVDPERPNLREQNEEKWLNGKYFVRQENISKEFECLRCLQVELNNYFWKFLTWIDRSFKNTYEWP
jgi:hypothetical protein